MPPPAEIEFVNRYPINVITQRPESCQVIDLAMSLVVESIARSA